MPPRRQARSASRLDRKSVHFPCSLGGRAWPMIPPRSRLFVDLIAAAYFGRTLGSPPGLPGGGMSGVLPVSGVGARISGSTPEGGHNTPSDFASLSPSGSLLWPVVVPSGTAPCGVTGCIGAQPPPRDGIGGAVWACGVLGDGGACALAAPDAASRTLAIRLTDLIDMREKRSAGAEVPPKKPELNLPPRAGRGRIRAIARSGVRVSLRALFIFRICGCSPSPHPLPARAGRGIAGPSHS